MEVFGREAGSAPIRRHHLKKIADRRRVDLAQRLDLLGV